MKKTPFTQREIDAFVRQDDEVEGTELQYAPATSSTTTSQTITLPQDGLDDFFADHPARSRRSPTTPFFWHSPVRRRDRQLRRPHRPLRPEDSIGERVVLLLLAIATVMAAVFLLLPFVTMRKVWRQLPQRTSALYLRRWASASCSSRSRSSSA